MKVSICSPISALSMYSNTDYHLILPDLAENAVYRKFYRNVEGYKIFDNGAHESETISPVGLFEYAEYFGVNEIVAPDVIGEVDDTLSMTKAFAREAKKHPEYVYMGVVQGSNMQEALLCMMEMLEIEYISNIGLPQHLCGINRVIRVLMAQMIAIAGHKGVHILGANAVWPDEVKELARCPVVQGIDTTFPVKMGLQGRLIHTDKKNVPRWENYFEEVVMPGSQKDLLITENINTYMRWCDGRP